MARNRFFLEIDPFPVDRTDSCFVATPALRDRLERILGSVREGARPVCITAPRGAGKTTLLEQVQKDLGPQWQVAGVSGASGLDRESFLDAFGSAFSFDAGDDGPLAEVLERLETHLDASLHRDRAALVTVDDADYRSAQTRARLDALLACRQSSRLRFITTREPAPDDATNEDAPIMLVDIPPLTRAQSDDYVHTRLSAAGLRGDSPFTDDMLRSIHNASGGRPGQVHRVAAKMLANRRHARRGQGQPGGSRRRFWDSFARIRRSRERSPDA